MMCPQLLLSDLHVLDTPILSAMGKSLRIAAKRYYVHQDPEPQDGLTLLLFHANGAHKEHWEPFLEALFKFQSTGSGHITRHRIREAWGFDHFTHGDSAVLNAEALDECETDNGPTVCDWGEAAADFANTHLRSHSIVLIGHSAGTCASMYCAKYLTQTASPKVKLESIILVEAPVIQREVFKPYVHKRIAQVALISKVLNAQTDQWPSRDSAYEAFKKRQPWKTWDDRVRKIHVEHGLRPLDETNPTSSPVVSKRIKRFEIASFVYLEPAMGSFDQINAMKGAIPIHAIFVDPNEVVPPYVHECFKEARKKGDVASIEHLPGFGHWILEVAPDDLAKVVFKKLGLTPLKAAL